MVLNINVSQHDLAQQHSSVVDREDQRFRSPIPHADPEKPAVSLFNVGNPREAILVATLAVLGAGLWVWFKFDTGINLEDALITFRYARNIVNGVGFVYSAGERVLGTTTPLLTLILALGGFVFSSGAIPVIASVFTIVAGACSGPVIYLLLKELGASRAVRLLTVVLFYADPRSVWAYTGGMETSLVVLLMVSSAYAVVKSKPFFAGILAALLLLTRIDGAVWLVLLFGMLFFQSKRQLVVAVASCSIALVPWLAFSIAYFGSPIPHTLAAKQTTGDWTSAQLLQNWLDFRGDFYFPSTVPGIGLAIFLGGVLDILRKRQTRLFIVVAYPLCFALALTLGRAPHFPWYMVPARWCALAVCSAGLVSIARSLLPRVRATRVGVLAGAVATLLVGLLTWGEVQTFASTATTERISQINENALRKGAGLWLNEHVLLAESVATEAIGYQGYFSERRIIDFAGLVSPEVTRIRRASKSFADAFHSILENLAPDYIVLRSYEVDTNEAFFGGPMFATTEQESYFRSRYVEVARLSAPYSARAEKLSHLTIFRLTGHHKWDSTGAPMQ
jgi:hypothetical protein